MPEALKISIGDRFHSLIILNEVERTKGRRTFKCKCDCGNITMVILKDLRSGHTKSCGCHKLKVLDVRNTTHGKSKTKLYYVWKNMRERCMSPHATYYKYYGGRGIRVCNEWQQSFVSFEIWANSTGYAQGLTIERVDVNGRLTLF